MDFFAHGLWAGAAGTAANRKLKQKCRLVWVVLWGVFPDVFAFGAMFVVMLWFRLLGGEITPRLLFRGPLRESLPSFLLPEHLYPLSHSLVVFSVVFAVVWLLFRRPALPMLAWGLHILMDVPTHGAGRFGTPFLWPLSLYRFDGIWWSQRWFMILNYSAIAAAYFALLVWFLVSKRRRERGETSLAPSPLRESVPGARWPGDRSTSAGTQPEVSRKRRSPR